MSIDNKSDPILYYENLIKRLTHIGLGLSAEKNIDKLLSLILDESIQLTNADAGSIFIKLVEDDTSFLEFTYTQNFSRDIPFNKFKMPINQNSIAGSVAISGKPLRINDMAKLPELLGIKHNDAFDKQFNYKSCNMLVIPLKNMQEEILGIMQLINKKTDVAIKLEEPKNIPNDIMPFTIQEQEIISSIASQAAILIERSKLYDEIQTLFESFIETMVGTIDQRDPITAGHSIRVAKYALAFAKCINTVNEGIYKDLYFNENQLKEIYYAGLLHDIGKIGVREYVLLKRNKLSDSELNALHYKFYYNKQTLLLKKDLSTLEEDFLNNFDRYLELVNDSNKRGFLPEDMREDLLKLKEINMIDFDGIKKPLLSEHEYTNLSVIRGNLTNEERLSIQEHARFTEEIVKQIPWGENLNNVPRLAADHHEKLNGFGYPNGFKEDKIPPGARIMAIVDIFDALTAKDRPYKPAMPIDKTLSILKGDAERNALDKDLVEIFIAKRPFEEVMEMGDENE